MRSLKIHLFFIIVLFFTACVTINVYFPAAAAEKAANKVIDNVWGKQQPLTSPSTSNDLETTDTPPSHDPEIEEVWGISSPVDKSEPTPPSVNDSNESSAPESTSFLSHWLMYGLDFLISPAYAEANLDISTPAIRKIEARLKDRHTKMVPGYDNGAIGLTNDALITLRDPSKVPLKSRQRVKGWIADENQDRLALYNEIAKANGHPEWKNQIQATFAERWIDRAKRGWWYQDKKGHWQRKR